MMTNSNQLTQAVLALAHDGRFQSEVAQVRAKAVLTEIAVQVPSYRWTYVAPRLIRNATAALFDLETIASDEPGRMAGLTTAARHFAQAWESLAKLGERTSRQTALINAAALYELAGYQANAACIARQLVSQFGNIEHPTLLEFATAFLQRLFLRVIQLADLARREPHVDGLSYERLWMAAALAIAADGFAAASRYFLSGNEQALQQARRVLERSERGFASLGLVHETNLVHTIRSLLPVMQARSTWTVLGNVMPDNPRWQRYLRLLARGLGQNVLRSASVSELWPSQVAALQGGLLSSSRSKIIRMPTSAGKSRIAELAMVHTLITQPNAKCIYVAPYRALVGELEQVFLNLFADLGFRVSSIIGTYESDDFEQLLALDADVLVVTPEKLDLLCRLQPDFLNRVGLIVVDEAHIVDDRTRGLKFELLLTRLKRRLPNARFILLSAVVPQETLEDFARWFNAQPNDIVTSDWRPAIQRFAKLEWKGNTGVLRYSPAEDIQLPQEFVPGIISQQSFEYANPNTGQIKRQRFPEPKNKAQTAAELAFKFAELGPVLVFCSQTNFVEAVARAIQLRLQLLEQRGDSIPGHFRTVNTRAALVSAEWLGDGHLISQFLKSGIAIHYRRLPDAVRKAVEADFRERRYRIIIATNTLAQGVNLPIRTVIVHSCWRASPDEEPSRISARDYWNIAGRAGRAREETEGTIIHIVRSEQDQWDYQYFLEHREKSEPIESALFKLLQDLVEGRLTEVALTEALDPEILAVLVEEGLSSLTDEFIDLLLRETLVHAQATVHNIPTQQLRKAFHQTSSKIVQEVPSAEYRTIYSATGLRTQSCETLRKHVAENSDVVRRLLTEAGSAEMNELAQMFLDGCRGIQEMQSEQEFAGSYLDLLQRWLAGTDISQLRAEFATDAPSLEDLAKFIEDFFGYRLPWGISGYIRIATKVLNLPLTSLSPYSRFFPSMVKFGVPFPEATWAMAAGIPFRRIAIEIASRYVQENLSSSYADFLGWLGSLNAEQLHYEFGLTSPILEDVARALARSGTNPLLRQSITLQQQLPIEVNIQGISYENRGEVALRAKPGIPVRLVRDYDSQVDWNAVKVELERQALGYLPRQTAQLLAPEMDAGVEFDTVITSVARHPIPKIQVRIALKA